MFALCSIKVHLLGKEYRRILFTSERVGMFSIVQETQYSFTNEIFTKATWISVHKSEQKLQIEISKYVHIGLHKPN
jgi:hypothetical protein